MDCVPPGSSDHGISQARILKWVAISFSRGSSHPGIEPVSPAWLADSLPLSQPGNPMVMSKIHLWDKIKYDRTQARQSYSDSRTPTVCWAQCSGRKEMSVEESTACFQLLLSYWPLKAMRGSVQYVSTLSSQLSLGVTV